MCNAGHRDDGKGSAHRLHLAQHPAVDKSQQMLRKQYKNRTKTCLYFPEYSPFPNSL